MTLFQHHLLGLSLISASMFGFGLFVFLKNPQRNLNRSMALYCLSLAWWSGWECAALQMPTRELSFVLMQIEYIGVVFIPTLFWTTLSYLLGFSSHARRKLFPLYLFSLGALCVTSIFPMKKFLWITPGPVHYLPVWGQAGPYYWIFLAPWFAIGILGHIVVFLRWRHSTGLDRARLTLFLWGSLLAYVGSCPEFALKYGIRLGWLNPFGLYTFPFYIGLLTYAVVQHQFLDIRVVIRRSLVYSILVTALTIGYFGLAYAAERVFQTTLGYRSLWVSLVAFAMMALACQPLKLVIQRLVDRLIFRAPQQNVARRMEVLEERVREGDRYKTAATLAASIAHELKNPLAAIQTFLDFFPLKHDDLEFRQQLQDVVGSEVKRLQQIAQGLLDFAKPQPLQAQPVDVKTVLDDVLALATMELRNKGLAVTTSYTHQGAVVVGDAAQLKQVFLNLILNAKDAMERGGALTIFTGEVNGHVEVHVADTGCGIHPKDLPHLFEPFFSRKANGNGLGLSIVHGIVQEHRGTIAVQSTPGRGTTFIVKLPV